MYAIIRDGGHQHRVEPGSSILIELRDAKAGDTITFHEVLYVDGKVGTPTVAGATVEAVVEGDVKGDKIYVVKYRRRKNYRRRTGHRQGYTKVQVKAIHG